MYLLRFQILTCVFGILFFGLSINANGQWYGSSPLYTTSNVGIGVSSPATKFHLLGGSILNGNVQIGNMTVPAGYRLAVDGNVMLRRSTDGGWGGIRSNILTGVLEFNIIDGPTLELYGKSYPSTSGDSRAGSIRLISRGSTGEGISFMNYDPAVTNWRRTMTVTNDNKVYIGNDIYNTPGTYKLYVETGILTEKVRVAVKGTASWADHVFAPEYKLLPLKELQAYISENNHLPEIPSAREVVQNGVDLGQMDAKLLQKIEELTLYVIQQQKEIDELKKKMGK